MAKTTSSPTTTPGASATLPPPLPPDRSPEIKTLTLAAIKPYWRNPRDNHAAVEKVKKSILDYGYNQFIAVDAENVIIVGHTRWRALQELGWKEVKVFVLSHLTEKQARAYRIVDNKTSEYATWTGDLGAELRELDTAVMQDYFVEDLSSILGTGESVADVTQAQVDKTATAVEWKFENADQGKTQEVACPECGHEFHIKIGNYPRKPSDRIAKP